MLLELCILKLPIVMMVLVYHPISLYRKFSKLAFSNGFVKISTICSFVLIANTLIVLIFTCSQKWWYFIVICFVVGLYFGSLANSKAPLLPSNTDECVVDTLSEIYGELLLILAESLKVELNHVYSDSTQCILHQLLIIQFLFEFY